MTLNLSRVLDNIKYKDWVLKHKDDYIQWTWVDTCSKTGEQKAWSGRKWKLSEHMTESEVVGTAFLALNTALEHEAREFFSYYGMIVFNPHISMGALMTVCTTEDIRKPTKHDHDPCSACPIGVVCRTPSCSRLKQCPR